MNRPRPALVIYIAVLAVVLQLWPVRLFRNALNVQVVSAAVTAAAVPRSLLATGTLTPTSSVNVGTTLTGAIESVEAAENSVVHAGQVLAHLEPGVYQAAVAAARATFEQTQAELRTDQATLEEAERERSRTTQLLMQPPAPMFEMQGTSFEIERLQAAIATDTTRVAGAYAAVNAAMMNLQLTAIRSPVDGIVLFVDPAAAGDGHAAGPPPCLFRIATDLSHLQVEANLTGADAEAIHPGDRAAITYAGQTVTGSVADVRHRSPDPETTTASAVAMIDVPNPDRRLRPGILVDVKLTGTQPATVVRIPSDALSFKPGAQLLDAIGEVRVPFFPAPDSQGAPLSEVWEFNGTEFTAVGVRTGAAEGNWTEILAGEVHPGDRLVTSAEIGGEEVRR